MADNTPNSVYSLEGDPNERLNAQGGAISIDPTTGDIYARDPSNLPGTTGWTLRNVGSGGSNAEVTLNGVQTLTNKTLVAPVLGAATATSITLPSGASITGASGLYSDITIAAGSGNRSVTIAPSGTGNIEMGPIRARSSVNQGYTMGFLFISDGTVENTVGAQCISSQPETYAAFSCLDAAGVGRTTLGYGCNSDMIWKQRAYWESWEGLGATGLVPDLIMVQTVTTPANFGHYPRIRCIGTAVGAKPSDIVFYKALTPWPLSGNVEPANSRAMVIAADGSGVSFLDGLITGGAANMTITSGTGASRTMILRTTTSGSVPTTALTLGADQSSTFAGNTVVGAIGTVLQSSIGMSTVFARFRERYSADNFCITTNLSISDVQDNAAKSSWEFRMGPGGGAASSDAVNIRRSPAGSPSSFANLLSIEVSKVVIPIATTASSTIVGAFVIGDQLTAATNVAMGQGVIRAGSNIFSGGTITTLGGATFHTTSSALTNGAGVGAGTITNAPAAGNPTKWIGIDDNGTVRYIPSW